jgi:flavodoxin
VGGGADLLQDWAVRVVVLYESLQGHTRRAAELIGGACRQAGVDVSVREVTNIDLHELSQADLLFVGTWVDGFVLFGQRPGRAFKFNALPPIDGMPVVAFATYAINAGGMMKKFAKLLRGKGADVVMTRLLKRNHLERDVAPFVKDALGTLVA